MLAQKRSSIDLSVTDPYFLDRNLVAGADVFLIQTNYLGTEPYDERRVGFALRLGYDFNDHLRAGLDLLAGRADGVQRCHHGEPLHPSQAGTTLLSQVSQVLTLDYRDSKVDPHSGFIYQLGHRLRRPGRQRAIRPHQRQRGVLHSARPVHRQQRLGLRSWRRVPATCSTSASRSRSSTGSSWAATTCAASRPAAPARMTRSRAIRLAAASSGPGPPKLRFPLPVSPDLGLSGRAFVDVGGADPGQLRAHLRRAERRPAACRESSRSADAPRVGAGVGISWQTQFGLINIDLTPFVIKQPGDQTQIFRFGFGTRF